MLHVQHTSITVLRIYVSLWAGSFSTGLSLCIILYTHVSCEETVAARSLYLGVMTLLTNLNGIARRKMSMGLGPVVYRLMNMGSSTCIGTMGTPIIARRSLGTPASNSLSPVAESAAAKPIWWQRAKRELT